MKAVILAGGFGTRISEESCVKPKPMVEIGGMPILWHIMKIYSSHGINEFIICCGYKGYLIKEYFANYFLHLSDLTIDLGKNQMQVHDSFAEPWKITLVNTGENTMTGGRIKRIKNYINDTFLLTYGDGVGDININSLIEFHRTRKKLLTVTAVQPLGRFGALNLTERNEVQSFLEKPKGDSNWVNGGFFVCEPEVIDYIEGDATSWEKEPLETLAQIDEMVAYKHNGYWKAMDTLRDKQELENDWVEGKAKWKIW